MEKPVFVLVMTLTVLTALFVAMPQGTVCGADGLGEALSFDGVSNYVSVLPIDANIYTCELWFKPEKNFALVGSNRFLIQSADQSLYVWHDVSAGFTEWYPISIGTGNWHHLAVIIDYITWQITPCLDGVNLGTKATTTNTKPPITWTTIGSHGNTAEFKNFKGVIDEVRIYNRTLSTAEISAHYNSGIGQYGRPEVGLVAGWHFDESSGTVVHDYSGLDYDGAVFGASWGDGHVPLPDIAVTSVTTSAAKVVSGDIISIIVTTKNLGTPLENFTVKAYYDNNVIGMDAATNLAPGASKNFRFNWNTTGIPLGMYTIKANITTVQGETNTADNELGDGKVWIVQHPVAGFTYSPTPAIANTSTTFDSSSSDPRGGSIINYTWDFDDDNITTTTHVFVTHVYASHGTYNVTLTVRDSEDLANSTWRLVDVLKHDEAVLNVTLYRNWIYEGQTIDINTTVANEGDFAETAIVKLYYNIAANEQIGTQTITLSPSEIKTLKFAWNTTGVPNSHNYTIVAIAEIGFDSNVTNNILEGRPDITVRIPGDLNGDNKVDMKDVLSVSLAFGQTCDQPKWNPGADINNDGKIDVKDFFVTVLNFGKRASA
jgi:PKD repeat protein